MNNTKGNPKKLPFHIINGNLSYINVLDAINSWNLVSELSISTNTISAASFKHTNAAGVSLTRELTDNEIKNNFIKNEDYNILSDTAKAYILARGVDQNLLMEISLQFLDAEPLQLYKKTSF